jgi:hypothetical protein
MHHQLHYSDVLAKAAVLKLQKLKGQFIEKTCSLLFIAYSETIPLKILYYIVNVFLTTISTSKFTSHKISLKNTAFVDHGVLAAGSGSLHNQVLFLLLTWKKFSDH